MCIVINSDHPLYKVKKRIIFDAKPYDFLIEPENVMTYNSCRIVYCNSAAVVILLRQVRESGCEPLPILQFIKANYIQL